MEGYVENTFVFIIPSYNNSKWYKKNLDSVMKQTYYKWRIIYVDDNSLDDTFNLVTNYFSNNNLWNRSILIKNDKNYGQAYSRYIAYNQCSDNEICVLLDGDDWLYDETVLSILNKFYNNYDLNLSYGSYVKFFKNKIQQKIYGTDEFPQYIVNGNLYSKYKWISCHLRTVRAQLLKSIPDNYLKDYDNNWLKVSTDLAEMLWVLKKSNGKHMNIKIPLYVYNVDNSLVYDTSYYNHKLEKYRDGVNKKIRFYHNKQNNLNVKTSINNIFDKVYVLNLNNEFDKFKQTKKRLKKYDIDCDRFEAVNGHDFMDEFKQNKHKEETNLYRSYGSYGCLKSKIKILEDAILNNYEKILILEDDIILIENFCEKFEEYYKSIPYDWKVLYFGSSDRNINNDEIINDLHYYKPTFTSNGTFAFGLDSSMFSELLFNFKLMNLPDDQHLVRLSIKYYNNSFVFYPNLIIADTTTSSTTSKFNYNDIYDIYHNRIRKFNWNLNKYDLEFTDSKLFEILLNLDSLKKKKEPKFKTTDLLSILIIAVIAIIIVFIYIKTQKNDYQL